MESPPVEKATQLHNFQDATLGAVDSPITKVETDSVIKQGKLDEGMTEKSGNGERGSEDEERGSGNGEMWSGNGERGSEDEERGSGKLERGSGNGEMWSGNGGDAEPIGDCAGLSSDHDRAISVDAIALLEQRISQLEAIVISKDCSTVSQQVTVATTYWEEGERLQKKPLAKQHPAHVCHMLPWYVKLSLMFTCVLNYADTVTDIVTTADMFRNEKYVLGSVSVLVMVCVGLWVPLHTRSLTEEEKTSDTAANEAGAAATKTTKWKLSWRHVLASLTLSSTQYFILKKFLLAHPTGRYDRRACLGYDNERCRTDKCNNLRHKIRQLHEAVILEKMVENLPQLFLQIINIAPEYMTKDTEMGGFWGYWKLVSLLLTAFSLTRACVKFDFVRLDLNPRLFSFSAIGKGWKAIYPQKYLLGLIHSSIIINKGLTVIYLAIVVNYNFITPPEKPKWCFITTALHEVRSGEGDHCNFESKVAWMLLLYIVAYYTTVALITLHVIPCYVYKYSLKGTLHQIKTLPGRILYVFKFIRGLWWIYILNSVLQQRHYLFDATNHLRKVGWVKFIARTYPSFLHAAETAVFSVAFYRREQDGGFSNVGIGITPFQLTLIGLGIEAVHLTSLLMLVYRADPCYIKSLSQEKIVEYLIRKGKVPAAMDVSCSRTAKDIIKEVVGCTSDEGEICDIYKEDIRDEIIKFSVKLPPKTRFKGIMEFHRAYAEAIRRYSGIKGDEESVAYTPLKQLDEEKGEEGVPVRTG